MRRPSQPLRFDFRFFLIASLGVIGIFSPLLYLLLERISSGLALRAEQSRLEQANLARSLHEIVPPPDPAAVQNCEKLVTASEGLGEFAKKFQHLVDGLELARPAKPGMAAPAFLEPTPVLYSSAKLTSPPSWQNLREQLSHASPILAEAHNILKSPIAPRVEYDSTDKHFDLGQTQALCAILKTKLIVDLAEGRVSDAIEELESINKIATMWGRSGSIVRKVLEMGMLSFAFNESLWEILQSPNLTEADLLRLQQILERNDMVSSMLVPMEAEAARMPQIYRDAIRSRKTPALLDASATLPGVFGNELLVSLRNELWPTVWAQGDLARTLHSWRMSITIARELADSRNWSSQREKIEKLKLASSSYDSWRFPASELTGAGYTDGMLKAAIRSQIRFEQAKAAVGLARYKLANSRYPAHLDQLVPHYLPSLPHDWYDGQPLRYRPLEDGSYLLYSIGEDCSDDGGDATAASGTGIRKPQTRDTVWPRAVPPQPPKAETGQSTSSTNP